MNRRGFIGSILALGAAPAIVRADSLMRIVPRSLGVLVAPHESLLGLVRKSVAYDIYKDALIIRIDTTNGVAQYATYAEIYEEGAEDRENTIEVATKSLERYVKEKHGSLAGFRAPHN